MQSFRRANQRSLFETTCPQCPLFTSCGGGRSAPCDCMYPVGHSSYHQCFECSYICRERYVEKEDGQFDTFQRRLASLTPLVEVQINQQIHHLPAFIPAKTYELPKGTQLDIPWASIDLKRLPVTSRLPITSPSSCWCSSAHLRQCLRVSPKTQLIAITNGLDPRLERFWGRERFAFYRTLKHCGVTAITGPTFSVHEYDRITKLLIPESEKVINMLRHNRVLQEANDYFTLPIPNLYWRNENDINNWSAWLCEHEHIHCVSRDLTCSGQYDLFVQDLIMLLEQTKRSMHIILLGVGSALAAKTIHPFLEIGCTVSIVSSDPIMKAIKAGRKLMFHGALPPTHHKCETQSRAEIALHNLDVMNRHVEQMVASKSA